MDRLKQQKLFLYQLYWHKRKASSKNVLSSLRFYSQSQLTIILQKIKKLIL